MKEGIAATNAAFMRAFELGDAGDIAELYTDDARLLPPGADLIVGKHGVKAFWSMVIDMGIASATLETVELAEFGDTAVEEGRFKLLSADGQIVDHGKFVVVWKDDGGTCKLHQDIWNSSQPAQ